MYQCPLTDEKDEQSLVYACSEILLSLNLGKTVTSYSMDEPWGHYAKWNKTFPKKTMSIFMLLKIIFILKF